MPVDEDDLCDDPFYDREEHTYIGANGYEYCKRHPGNVVSNGQFDAPCGACESECEEASEKWEHDRENAYRSHCGMSTGGFLKTSASSVYDSVYPAWGNGLGNDSGYFLNNKDELVYLVNEPDLYFSKGCNDVEPGDDEIPF